jgi:hypothetical protein
MLESLFSITRDFDMPTQPHLLLLQKTMVMNEGVATALDPDINMWETAEPFLREWMRSELGPRPIMPTGSSRLVRAAKLHPRTRSSGLTNIIRRSVRPRPPAAARNRNHRAPALGRYVMVAGLARSSHSGSNSRFLLAIVFPRRIRRLLGSLHRIAKRCASKTLACAGRRFLPGTALFETRWMNVGPTPPIPDGFTPEKEACNGEIW